MPAFCCDEAAFTLLFQGRSKTVASALVEAGASIGHHGDHFEQSTPDTDWLTVVGETWVGGTNQGKAISKKQLELMAIARAEVKIFTLVFGNLTRRRMAELFVDVLEKLKKFARCNQAPFSNQGFQDENAFADPQD